MKAETSPGPERPASSSGSLSAASHQQDQEWVKACQRGNRDAFRHLYDRYHDRVYWIAWKFTFNKEQALDLTQDVFVKVFKNIDKYQVDATFATWLTRVATNTCIDFKRKQKQAGRTASLSDDALNPEILTGLYIACGEDPSKGETDLELRRTIDQAVAGLSDKHREVFVMYALKEFSYQQIAEVVGVSIGTVMSRLFYARKYLQEALVSYLEREQ